MLHVNFVKTLIVTLSKETDKNKQVIVSINWNLDACCIYCENTYYYFLKKN